MRGAKKVIFHVQFCQDLDGIDVKDCTLCGKYEYEIVVKAEIYNLTKKKPQLWARSYHSSVSTE